MRKLAGAGVLAALALGASVLVPLDARSEDKPEAPVAGLRLHVSHPGLVKLKTTHLLELLKGSTQAKELLLTTRGETVPFYVGKDGTEIFFWGEPDPESRDVRGRSYHLRPALTGQRPVILGAHDPVP
ncbi:hypothetical protein HY251_20750, partial [bacterium]|nr:hypothetical protein [bacterium]